MAAWIKRDSTGRVMLIATQGEGTHNTEGSAFYFGFLDDNTVYCTFWDDTPTITSKAYTDLLWHHYACTYDQQSMKRTIYVDGQPAVSSNARIPYQNQGDFVIGQNGAALDLDQYLHGEMDNLLVVNRALSSAEMVDVFETPMAVFDLDEAPGSQRFINGVDGGTDGVCSGTACPAMGVAGKAFTAARFDGVDDAITIPGNTSIPLTNSSFTLSAWAKRDRSGALDILMSQGIGATNQGMHFGFRPTNVFTCAFFGDDLDTTATYTDTEWHHWVCTYDATSRRRTLYRDGQQVASDTAQSNYEGTGGATHIGNRFANSGYFQGTIDEVGVFPEALSADAVEQLYQKVKIQDASTLTCQLPLAESDGQVAFGVLTLRETTTRLGDISQTVTRTVTVDNDNPIVTIRTLDNNQYVSVNNTDGGMVSVSGVATDTTSYIAGVQVQTDGGGGAWIDVSGTEAWAYNWDVSGRPDGKHTVTVQAFDAVGNASAGQSVSFIVDRTAPTIWAVSTVQPTQNAAGQWYVPLIGNVSDPNAGSEAGSGVATVEVLLQGRQETTGNGWQTVTLAGDTWTLDYILPRIGDNRQVIVDPSGVYTVTLRATDAVSNTTPADAYPTNVFTFDVTAPALTVNLPLSVTQVISTELMVNGSVQDASGVATVEVNLTPAEQIGSLDSNVLHLPMDETRAGAYFDDRSGSNHDATCTGGGCPTVGEAGQRDGAFGFDGTNDYLDAGDAIAELAQADFSIGAWVKTTGNQVAIVTKSNGDNTWQTGEKSFYLDGAGVPNFVGWGDSYIRGATAVNDGAWHHVLVTWDYSGSGAAGTGKIYVDGTDDTASTTNYAALHTDNAGDTLKIGRPNYGNEAPKFFVGLLDEVIVYDRALADYEAANLYAYGQVTWQPATLANGTWSYTIPEGENGVEGLYQINVRGTDLLGNTTDLSGQRGWRGEIDTRPPSVQFVVTTNESGSTPSTKYECIVTDFNLLQESDSNGYQTTSCVPGFADVPFYKNSDLTLTTYANADPWYAATITDTARLYGMDAVRTYAGGPADDLKVFACDLYNRCTTALPELRLADPLPSAAAEILAPPSGTVLTSTVPISVSGDVYADNGLRALRVLNNGTTVHLRNWETPAVMSELWEFTWTPPGEGIYRFTTIVDDWTGIRPPEPAGATPDGAGVTDAEGGSMPALPDGITPQAYLPWISAMDASGGIAYYLPLIAKGVPPTSDITGTVTTLYVDLTPPNVVIESTLLTTEHALGPRIAELSGTASDATALHRVDVRIGDGPWQRAGLDSAGRWRFPWRLDILPADRGYQVSARATDLAGRTTIVTATVIVSAQ
ncbi:MAG: hypothetical protein H6643_06920 [Caldilineaceae bacterium]|nr:hypothetical protein [Caldilinea sp.]MCB0052586.1 hypothetical protein [Caldilinea sp.]MCB9124235.1 hypothetical protein [Caldilineaceae bacterium]